MSDEVDAGATLAVGTIVAAQVDPYPGAQAAPGQCDCANCGARIDGNFCANCGQTAHVARSIGHIFHDLMHGLLHFDSKGWRTLPMLVFRPGRLTRDYVEGKRARYVAPFAMFLFTVFLMYFTFAFIGAPAVDVDTAIVVDEQTVVELRSEIAGAEAEIARLERRGAVAAGEIRRERAVLKVLETALRRAEAGKAAGTGTPAAAAPEAAGSSFRDQLAAAIRSAEIDTGNAAIDDRIRAALQNPELLFYKMQQSAYKFSFLLVPLSLPFVWLLFAFRRGAHLYDHAVFTLYSMAFMSFLFVLAALLASVGVLSPSTAVSACLFVPPVHMFVQLKGAYRLGVAGALVRAVLLTCFAVAVLTLFVLAVIALGVF